MSTLRRYSALVAALVLVCVSVQILDLGLCCDTTAPAPPLTKTELAIGLAHAGGFSDSSALSSTSEERRNVPSPMTKLDCLCHLVFTSTSLAPAVVAATSPISLLVEAPEPLRSALLPPPGHVPIA